MLIDLKYDESWKGEYKYMGMGCNNFSDVQFRPSDETYLTNQFMEYPTKTAG
jgi:hypothetical protein